MFTLNCKGKIISIIDPIVMGIINVTPDSFYKGYLNDGNDAIIDLAEKMIADGATILDVGGQSTRPGSSRISQGEELERIIPVIQQIRQRFPDVVLSVDTYFSVVAEQAVHEGADMINDISAGEMDNKMLAVAGSLNVPYICMHMKGTPATMQENIHYDNLITDVLDYFVNKISACYMAGIKDVIIDPGFGFGKTISLNFQLLHQLNIFQLFNLPLMVGISRKSTVYKTLNTTSENALNGSTVLHTLALQNGANILRVHDVKEAVEAIKLMDAYKKAAFGIESGNNS